jgi:hypothetical protein
MLLRGYTGRWPRKPAFIFQNIEVGQNRQFRIELRICHINTKKHGEYRGCNVDRSDDKKGLKMMSLVLPELNSLKRL